MKQSAVSALLVILLSVFQLTLADVFRVFNVKPDLLFVALISAGIILEKPRALFFGIFAGIVKDIFVLGSFGTNTFAFPVFCLLLFELKKQVPLDSIYVRILLVFVLSVLYNLFSGLSAVFYGKLIYPGIFLRIITLTSLYSVAVFPLIYKLLKFCKLPLEYKDIAIVREE